VEGHETAQPSARQRSRRSSDASGLAFLLGAEKWGLSETAADLVDQAVFIPMRGMVQSLHVSVAAATLLFEALRQRRAAGVLPSHGEGLPAELYQQRLFEWAYPQVATWCRQERRQGCMGQGSRIPYQPQARGATA
jgi:tRNA (guanosine-2'-O-)-methyltransferase